MYNSEIIFEIYRYCKYGKCPKISFTKIAPTKLHMQTYANSADIEQSD